MLNKILSSNYWALWDDLHERDVTTSENVNSESVRIAIQFSCYFGLLQQSFFQPMWMFPYFFRAFRLFSIWQIHLRQL